MDELLSLALILYVLVSTVLGVLRRERARTRPPDWEEGEGAGEGGRPWRDWEEELRDLFERTRERRQAEGGAAPTEPARAEPSRAEDDDRPWLEIEPIPPLDWPPIELPWPPYGEPPEEEPVVRQAGEAGEPGEPERAPAGLPGGEGEPPAAPPEPVPEPWASPRPLPVPPASRAETTAPAAGVAAPSPVPAPALREAERPLPSGVPQRVGDGAVRGREREALARRVRRRLWSGKGALLEAVVLCEVLGPPRALRPHRPRFLGM